MSILNTEPHWLILTLFGAILGAIIPFLFKPLVVFYERLKHKSHLEGKWYEYHTTYLQGKPTIYETHWIIKKGIRHQFSILCSDEKGKISYYGDMSVQRSQLTATLKSKEYDVTVAFRLTYPIPSSDRVLIGFWVSFDHDVKIASGTDILSRDPLSQDEIEAILDKNIQIELGIPLMRIKV